MQVVLLHSFQNVLKAVLGHRKVRRVTSTSSGLKRLKTQNTTSGKRKGDALKGIPKSIHKRELILDEEKFDASTSGGLDGSRTRVRNTIPCPSTSVVYYLTFPLPHDNKQPCGFSSFMIRPMAQSFANVVSHIVEAWVLKCECSRSDCCH